MLEFGLIQWLEFFLYTFEAMPECKVAEMWIFGYITDHWKTCFLHLPMVMVSGEAAYICLNFT